MTTADSVQQRQAARRTFDWRTFGIMAFAVLAGAAWAYYNYLSTGGQRGDPQLRPLVWTIFAVPFALFIGWSAARWSERWFAAFICFCFYFFTPFVAARFESLFMGMDAARLSGHDLYFRTAMTLHLVVGLGIAVWRALTPQGKT